MAILSDEDKGRIIDESGFDPTLNQMIETDNLFKREMLEEANKDRDIVSQKLLFGALLDGVCSGDNPDILFNRYSDNKHLDYLQFITGSRDEMDYIIRKMQEAGISTGVLKYLTRFVTNAYSILNNNGKKVTVIQKYEKQGPASQILEDFIIQVDGEEIYSFKEHMKGIYGSDVLAEEFRKFGSVAPKSEYTKFQNKLYKDFEAVKHLLEQGKTNITSETKKVGKNKIKNVSYYRDSKGRFATMNNNRVLVDKDKNGNKVSIYFKKVGKNKDIFVPYMRDSKGRFTNISKEKYGE